LASKTAKKTKIKTKKTPNTRQAAPPRADEVRAVARNLTVLALVRLSQGGALNVRQRENLRRALSLAAETLNWNDTAATSDDPLAGVSKEVKKIVRTGAKNLQKELADEVALKKTEESRLKRVVETVQVLAESPDGSYPAQITYSHTANDAAHGLITKTETITVADAQEAQAAAQTIERSLTKWGKLRDQMLEELKQKQKNLGILSDDLSHFVESWQGLLGEVLVTLT
jgi:hypothetical protein